MKLRTYTELRSIQTFEERFKYLMIRGTVGQATFGYERWMNQKFYTSQEWRTVRHDVIARDLGCDLGVAGFEIHSRLIIHHMNPIQVMNLIRGDQEVLDLEYLITTTHRTHNAIHYGDESLLPKPWTERKKGDTKLW